MEGLKEFISQRLRAATSEILGAVVRNLTDLEEQTERLKEENQRLRSLLDIIVKSTEASREAKITPPPSDPTRKPAVNKQAEVLWTSNAKAFALKSKSKCLFTTREDLLKVQDANGNCPYCIKRFEATEVHLLKRHYSRAIHFVSGGTEKFVIPCMCKDKIQGRSHWHCPCCQKIIYRTCNFETHLNKLHGYATQQQRKDDVTEPEARVSGEPVQSADGQTGEQSLELNYDQELTNNIMCANSFIEDINEIISVHDDTRRVQPMVTDAECETSQDTSGKAAENVSSIKTEGTTQLSSSDKPSGSHSCKACEKVFSHMLKLKAHAQTHAMDKKPTCGICGKHPKPTESLALHLQSHSTRNKCVRCRKQFSCSSRLKRHMKFHKANFSNTVRKNPQV